MKILFVYCNLQSLLDFTKIMPRLLSEKGFSITTVHVSVSVLGVGEKIEKLFRLGRNDIFNIAIVADNINLSGSTYDYIRLEGIGGASDILKVAPRYQIRQCH